MPAARNTEAGSACKRNLTDNACTAYDARHRLQDQGTLLSLDLFVHCDSFEVFVVLFQLHPSSRVFAVLQQALL